MSAWIHWLMGAGFFGFALFQLLIGGSPWLVGLAVVAAAYLFYRALNDQTGAPVEDLELAVGFVRDPYGTVFEETVTRVAERVDQPRGEQEPGPLKSFVDRLDTRESKRKEPGFDADAAIARYLANRPAPEAPPLRGFGRTRA